MNYTEGNLEGCRDMLLHPSMVPGLADTGAQLALDQDRGRVDVFEHQRRMRGSGPQALFDPLREAFDHAMKLPSMKAMRRSLSFFLSKCEDYRKRGHLVCSWHGSAENAYGNIDVKTSQASHAATNYAQRIQPAYV